MKISYSDSDMQKIEACWADRFGDADLGELFKVAGIVPKHGMTDREVQAIFKNIVLSTYPPKPAFTVEAMVELMKVAGNYSVRLPCLDTVSGFFMLLGFVFGTIHTKASIVDSLGIDVREVNK